MTLTKDHQKTSLGLTDKSSIRSLVLKTSSRIWTGCVYSSSVDSTSEIILLVKSISGDHHGRFLKKPFFVLRSFTKQDVITKIDDKIKILLKYR